VRAGWPDWLCKYIGEFEAIEGPAEFKAVVQKLVTLETLLNFPVGQVYDYYDMMKYSNYILQGKAMALSKVDRPDIIGRWIAGGRKSSPVIGDLPGFMTLWKKWWVSLQPSSRGQHGRKLRRVVNEDEEWEELQKGSINGFFTVVISLSWWLTAATTPAHHKAFLEVVEDVSWVQDQIIAKLKPSLKRGREDMADGKKVKRSVDVLFMVNEI